MACNRRALSVAQQKNLNELMHVATYVEPVRKMNCIDRLGQPCIENETRFFFKDVINENEYFH